MWGCGKGCSCPVLHRVNASAEEQAEVWEGLWRKLRVLVS